MATLEITDGGLRDWQSFEIDKSTTTIGRHGDFKTPRFQTEVSRIHCAIMHDGAGTYQVRDLISFSGTSVNGKSIGTKSKSLHGGDKVSLGNHLTIMFSR